jgi:YHS domain-containing protein
MTETKTARRGGEELEAAAIDPVCGAAVAAGQPGSASLRHAGRTWRFCGPACRGRFARLAEQALLSEALRAGRLLSRRSRARWGVA